MNVHMPPPSTYLDDMSLSHLNTAELLLTATVRLYAVQARGGDYTGLDWHEGLLSAGVRPCAVVAFGIVLDAIFSTSQKALDIRCPLCPDLGEDEGKILQVISLLQQQRFGEAHAILGNWLPPLEQSAMIAPTAHLALACAGHGLRVPWRSREEVVLEYFDAPCSHPGEGFVH